VSDKMKNAKKIIIGLCLVIFVFPFGLTSAQTDTDVIPRDEAVWSVGYWAAPDHWNPAFWGGEAWGAFFMYLPMFDYNFQTDELISFLGKTMEWNADGSELTITMHEEATWSDGVAITAQDVNWTFNYFYDVGQWGGGFSSRVDTFTINNDYEFVLEMNADYYFSKDIWWRFVGYPKVLPQHIWDAVIEDKSGAPFDGSWDSFWSVNPWPSFTNNWLEEGFPEEWKVGSGPYVPYHVSETKDKQVYKKVDTWWADGVLFDNFADMPTYIGQLHYATNFAMNSAFADDQVDWYGGYYPRIWELLEENSNIHTWVEEDPYFLPTSGMVELVPNHRRYPFDQHWFREVLAYAINYEDLSEVSASGYLEKARVGWVDDRSPTQDDYYDETVEETYAYEFNNSKSTEILEEYCFKVGGTWYTKNSDAYFNETGAGGEPVIDDLPTMADDPATDVDEATLSANINVALGGYDIIVPYGWSDSMMQTVLLSNYFADIGIITNPSFIEYGTYLDAGVQNGGSNFDLMNFVMGFAPSNEIFEGLRKFVGDANSWANWSAWESQEMVDLIDDLEVAVPNSQAEIDIAHDVQLLLAQELPSIPISPNGYWYAYNEKYWTGWPNEKDPFIQAVAPWETGRTGDMLYILMNLSPAGEGGPVISGFSLGLVFLSALGAITFVKYRSKRR